MDSENYSQTKLEEDKLIFSSLKVREGWAKSFQEMAANNDDELLINDTIPSKYDEEWEW